MPLSKADREACMAALQDWYEGGTPTYPKLSAASGINITWIKEYAAIHNWKTRSRGRPKTAVGLEAEDAAEESDGAAAGELVPVGSTAERLARVMDLLFREVEAIGVAAQAKRRPLDKGRIDALGAMIRTLEKFEEFARERSRDGQIKRDEEMGDVLRRIDGRIKELARAYARELGGGECERSAGAADPG